MPDAVHKRKKGIFITFEGIDGAGKSTQLLQLAARYRDYGYDVVTTYEPGGSQLGAALRKILLDPTIPITEQKSEILLFFAARCEHIKSLIMPGLLKGAVVLCDRFLDSTHAYQADHYHGLLGALGQEIIADCPPDVTLIFDLDPKIATARRVDNNRYDHPQNRNAQEKIRLVYQKIARQDPKRCVLLDADCVRESLTERIFTILRKRRLLRSDNSDKVA